MSGASLEREGAVGVITIDNPPVNAMSPGIPGAILERLAEAQADNAVEAVVLRCAGKGGLAGADIRSFGKPWPKGEPTLRDVIQAIERSAKPVIVALNGYCLGGGLELALSCHYRVASRKTEVGQPEVLLGFPPGAGGTQRLPRLAGVEKALAMIVDGTHVAATEAAEYGIIDRVIDGDLLEGALAFASERIAAGPPHSLARERAPVLKDPDVFTATRKRLERRARGQRAPIACLECVESALTLPFDEGVRKERETFEECMASPESAALRHVFFAERAVRKVPGIGKDTPARVDRARRDHRRRHHGQGHRHLLRQCRNSGAPDGFRFTEALERALAAIRSDYERRVSRVAGSAPADAEARVKLIEPIESLEGVAGADLVIEAVFEEMPLKEEVFRALDSACDVGAIIASNTSYLDVNRLADMVPPPKGQRARHALLQPGAGDAAPGSGAHRLGLARNAGNGARARPAARQDRGRGGRLPRLHRQPHAGRLHTAGALPAGGRREPDSEIDAALTGFGMAMGPCAVADLAGLDVSWRKRKAEAHLRDPSKRYSAVADRLCERGRFGQKTGAGYYRYEPGSRTPIPDPEVDALIALRSLRRAASNAALSAQTRSSSAASTTW